MNKKPCTTPTKQNSLQHAFTLVELLIVIVVIAILAALSYVGYTAISSRAIDSTLKSDLSQAAKQLGVAKIDNNDAYPNPTLPPNIKASDGNTFEYTSDGQSYCLSITSTKSSSLSYHINSVTNSTTPQTGVCSGHAGPVAGGGGGGTTIANNSPIQDVTQSQCQALPTYTGTNDIEAVKTVTDSRGGGTPKTYRIAKLADNKCWMLDNLKLGSTSSSITLTPADSDIASNFTLPQVTTSGSADYDNPGAYGPVPGDTGSGATNYGYLYNWSAATAGETRTSMPAGSGNAANSICAKGWRLPTGGTGGDFAQLDQAFGGPGTGSWSGEANVAKWQHNGPFKGVFAGVWWEGFYDQGSNGDLWPSSAHPDWSGYAFYAEFDADVVRPGYNYGYGSLRYNGFGVRCLLY